MSVVENDISGASAQGLAILGGLALPTTGHVISQNRLSALAEGILIVGVVASTISDNTMEANVFGITGDGSGLIVARNNFLRNTQQVTSPASPLNKWHDLVSQEGNYWSDYDGQDSGGGAGKHSVAGDGIGDTSFPWPSIGYDEFPFVAKNLWQAPPVLSPIGARHIQPGQTLVVLLEGHDPRGLPVTFSSAGLPPGATFDASMGRFSWTPTAATTTTVRFLASNGTLTDYEDVLIKVIPFSASSSDGRVSLVSGAASMSVTLVSTATADVSLALASATAQGLQLVSAVYDLMPKTNFLPPATLTFKFDPTVVTDTSTLAIYRFNGAVWSSAPVANQIVTTGLDPRVTGNLSFTSFYALFVRGPDRRAPRTLLQVGHPRFSQNPTFITEQTPVSFSAVDDWSTAGDASGAGVAQTFYAVGSGEFQSFQSPLQIAQEGVATVRWYSVDLVGNLEMTSEAGVAVDGTPPSTELRLAGVFHKDLGGELFVAGASSVVLSGEDPVSGGVASGLAAVEFRVDPSSAAQFSAFAAPFMLSEGRHSVEFRGRDNVGNVGPAQVRVVTYDAAPPTISVLSPSSGSFVATRAQIVIRFTVADAFDLNPSSGATLVQLEDRGSPRGLRPATIPVSLGQAIEPLALDDGLWVLRISASDFVLNEATGGSSPFEVVHDTLPPVSTLSVGAPQVAGAGGVTFVTRDTVLTLTSLDDLISMGDGVGLGVTLQEVSIDGVSRSVAAHVNVPTGQPVLSTFTLSGEADGFHTVRYLAEDSLQNREAAKGIEIAVDNEGPVTSLAASGATFVGPDSTQYASLDSRFILQSEDPAVGGVASGLARTEFQDNGSTLQPYSAAFTLIEGSHVVDYRSYDRLGNAEVLRSTTVLIDGTAPVSTYSIGDPLYVSSEGASHVSPGTRVFFTASDPTLPGGLPASGLKQIEVAVDGSVFGSYSQPMSLAEGVHAVSFRAEDNVGNVETSREVRLRSDATAPVSSFGIGRPRFDPGGGQPIFVALKTALTLVAQDPLVQDVAAGVRAVSFRRDGEVVGVYEAPFTLALPEGRKTVEYFATDNVGNLEVSRLTTLTLDDTPPQTELAVIGGVQYLGASGARYVSSAAKFALPATDPLAGGAASGVALTEFKDSDAAFEAYASPFALAEGVHVIYYRSQDRVENLEVTRSTTIFVDAMPPVTLADVGVPLFIAVDGTRYVAPETLLTFSASDPALPGGNAGSGVLRVEVALDGGPFLSYTSALTLGEGRHMVEFRAVDNVGNVESARRLMVQADATAPSSTLAILGGRQAAVDAHTFYASSDTRLAFVSSDPAVADVASGLAYTEFQDNGGEFQTMVATFMLGEGVHELLYRSQDNVKNVEVLRSTTALVDATAPVSAFALGTPYYGLADGTNFVSPATPVSFSAVDPLAASVASQVERIEVNVDGAGFLTYTSPLTFAEGRHVVLFRAIDRVGNVETARTLALQSDETSPLTSFQPSGELYNVVEAGDARSYAPPAFSYTLTAADPVAGDVASGVASTWLGTDAGALRSYAGAFTLNEGIHRIEYQSLDNVGNQELLRGATVFVDAAAPTTALAIGLPRYDPGLGQPVFVAAKTTISLSAQDPLVQEVASGVSEVSFRRGGDAFAAYQVPFAVAGPDGVKEVEYFAADNVGNAETRRLTTVALDETAPRTTLALLGGVQFSGSDAVTFYASSDTRVDLAASDPVVNGVASGLAATRFQDNDGPFQAFSSAFTLAEGVHRLAYYSQDRVENSEVPRSRTVLVDATPPMTLAQVGSPQFVAADGSRYIAPTTLVSFSASDPSLPNDQPGSGVRRIETSVDGGEFVPFVAGLSFPQGRHVVEFRAVDNVGNVEVAQVLKLKSDGTTPQAALEVLGGRHAAGPDAGTFYASSDTRFSLGALDPMAGEVASGVAFIEYEDNGGAFQTFVSAFSLGEGAHSLRYRSHDNVANREVLRSTTVLVDATPPVSSHHIGSPHYMAADGTDYVNPTTPVTISAGDPLVGGVASQVERIEVSLDGSSFVTYASAMRFAEGHHVVLFRAIDRVGNVEETRTLQLQSDETPPLTALEPSSALFTVPGPEGPRGYASLHTSYSLPAVDPSGKEVASGVAFTRFRTGQVTADGSYIPGALQPYSTAFSLTEGVRRVEFQSEDNVDNVESLQSATVFVDATAAISTLAIGLPRYDQGAGHPMVIGPDTALSLSALDPLVNGVASGVRKISFRRGDEAFAAYQAPFTLALPDGVKTIEYFSGDNVGNVESRRTTTVALDDTPPRTALVVQGGTQLPGTDVATFYASSDTRLSFQAVDPAVNGVASGLALTRYQDNDGPFQTFTSEIRPPEGSHLLVYQSLDRVDNMEALRSTTILVDATPPVTRAHVGSPFFVAADGTNYVAPATPVTFSATDPVLPGGQPGSEVLGTEVALDGGPFVSYSSALRFTEGRHRITFRSVDNVGNVEGAQTLEVLSDETASQTALAVLGGKQTLGGDSQTFYASSDTRFALVASDPVVRDVASGVAFVEIQDNGGAFQTGASVFGLAEGGHELRYRSQDNVQNLEVLRSTTVLVDATAPISTYSIGAPHYRAADGTNFVSPTAPVTFSAVDPLAAGVASQVESIEVSVDGAGFTTYTAPLTFNEGRHVVLYRSIDRVGNIETARTLELQSDDTPPLTSFRPSGELYTVVEMEGARSYAPAAFSYALLAADPVAKDVASGVATTWYRTTVGARRSYSGVFTLDEGIRRVEFQSRDNVENEELVRGATVYVDATAPVSSLEIGLPRYDSGSGQPVFVAAKTVLSLSAQDPVVQEVASGVRQISFRRDADATAAYEVPFALTGVDGVKKVEYLAEDNVGNAEAARSTAVALDSTSPDTALAVVGGAQFPGPDSTTFYASSDTRLAFVAVDPLVNGVGSGLAFTEFQDGDGAFERYGLAFGLSEGAHELRYRSQDRVDNLEVPRSTTVLLDASAPLSASHVGTPSFESADGSIYIVPTTQVSFTAADPALPGGRTGSGVRRIEVAVDGSQFSTYASALAFSEGAHTIEFRATDNVGNVESTRILRVRCDNTVPLTALKASGSYYSDYGPGGQRDFAPQHFTYTLPATDPVINDVASGLDVTRYGIDGGAPQIFGSPFTLAEGIRRVEFQSRDHVANLESIKTATIHVDATAPVTALSVIGGRQYPGPDSSSFYASSATRFGLPAADPEAHGVASGLRESEYQDNGAAFQTFGSPFGLSEGVHELSYRSRDQVLNLEVPRSTTVLVDATPPKTTAHVGQPFFLATDGTRSITPATPVTFTASDPTLPGTTRAGSQVDRIDVSIDGGAFIPYALPLTFTEGRHIVLYRSVDNVGNSEAPQTLEIQSDATAPLTALRASGAYYSDQGPGGPRDFAPQHFTYTLPATDPVVNDVASGLDVTRYGIDGGASQIFGSPFTLDEGIRRVEFQSQDHVANLELIKTATIYVDATAPVTALSVIGGRQYPGPDSSSFYASSATRFGLPAADPEVHGVASGLMGTEHQDNGAPFQAFGPPVAFSEGVHALSYRSRDRVLNLEVPRSTTVLVDATPPVTTVHVGQPLFVAADGTSFITPATPVTFTSNDPQLSGTTRPGAQVAFIEVSIDGGAFNAYASALTFAEGRHTVLFRAVDNVGNVEAVQTVRVRSDATAPVSALEVGTPQHRLSDGTLIVSSFTPVGIPAADPVVADVASGVRETLYRVSDVAGSTGAFLTFGSAFRLTGADVLKTIEFYSRDNVLNTEAGRSERILLDSKGPEVALLSPPACEFGICRVVKGRFPVLGTARDLHFAEYALESAPGRDASTGFVRFAAGTAEVVAGSLGVWDASALSDWQTLRLTARDTVGNVTVLVLNIFVGDPATLMSLGNHETFNMPEGVAVGPEGRVYVADRNNDRVAMFSSTGTLLGSIAPALNKPQGVAVDLEGNLLIADTNNSRVVRVSQEGQVLLELARRNPAGHTLAGKGPGEFSKPSGVAVDGLGAIYVADTLNERIQIFSSSGVFVREFALPLAVVDGNSVAGQPTAIAVDAAGRVYVADGAAGRALRLTGTGALELEIPIQGEGGVRGTPSGIAVTPTGECIVVSDSKDGWVLKFDRNGAMNLAFGTRGRDSGAAAGIQLRKPIGLALEADGSLLVVDRNGDRIKRLGLPNRKPTLVVPAPNPGDEYYVARDVIASGDGGAVERADKAGVIVPADALSEDMKITVSTPTAPGWEESSRHKAIIADKSLNIVSAPIEYQPHGTSFNTPVTLIIPYSADLVAAYKASEKSLKIHFWNPVKRQWEELVSEVDPIAGVVRAKTTHFSLYQVLASTGTDEALTVQAAADESFAFRDLYVYPNPARGGSVPKLHLAVGVADKVSFRIFDAAGREVHRATLEGRPPVIDDGSGAKYAYEHAWEGHIPSGVYLFVVEAEKAGAAPIRKAGRFGVVR